MKVETDGESWNRAKLLKLNNVNPLQAPKTLRTKALACQIPLMSPVSSYAEVYTNLGFAFVLGLNQTILEIRRERHHPLIFSQ